MSRLTACNLLILTLVTASINAFGTEPSPSDFVSTYTLPGAFKVARPNARWEFAVESKDPDAVTLVNKDAGLQIILRWVSNKDQIESRRAAAALMSKLLRAPDSTGKKFSFPRHRTLGGQPAYSFTVDKRVDERLVHRTEYVLAAYGKKCLVVVVSGGTGWLERHQKEVDRILASIAFVR